MFLKTLQKTLQIQQQSKDLDDLSVSNPIHKEGKYLIKGRENMYLELTETRKQDLKDSVSEVKQDSPPMLVRNNIQRDIVDFHLRSLSAD